MYVILFCAFPHIACAAAIQAPFTFTRFSEERGMITTHVEKIIQGRFGHLWIASQSGLFCFDGRVFSKIPLEKNTLYAPSFENVLSSDDGTIWALGNDKTLYYVSSRHTYLKAACDYDVSAVYYLGPDKLFLVTEDNIIFHLAYAGDEIVLTEWLSLSADTDLSVTGMEMASDGSIYTMTDNAVYKDRELYLPIPVYCAEEYQGRMYFGCDNRIIKDNDGYLSVFCSSLKGRVSNLFKISDSFEFLAVVDGSLHSIDNGQSELIEWQSYIDGDIVFFEDKQHHTWLYSKGGSLMWYRPSKKILVPFLDTTYQSEWSPSTFVTAALCDNQGYIWFSDSRGSLTRSVYGTGTEQFKLLALGKDDSTSANSVTSLYFDDDTNLSYVAFENGNIQVYDMSNNMLLSWMAPSGVNAISKDKNGMWFGTKDRGLIRVEGNLTAASGRTLSIYDKSDGHYGPVGSNIYDVNSADPNRLWLSFVDGGIAYLDTSNDERKFISRRNLISFPTESAMRARHSIFDNEGRLLIASNIGVFICENPSDKPENMRFRQMEDTKDSRIYSMLLTGEGKLLVCSAGRGLLCFDSIDAAAPATIYTTDDGLMSNFVYRAVEDENGCIWLATRNGLNKFVPETGSVIGYSYERMGINTRFMAGEAVVYLNGRMYFGTENGLLYFDPNEISNSSYVPEIIITDCLIDGKSVDLTDTGTLKMKAGASLLLSFNSIDLSAPERVLLYYKVEGIDDEWHQLIDQSYVSLVNLKPGKYVVSMYSTNGAGVTVENQKDIQIKVIPEFGFLLEFIMLLSGFCLAVFVYHKRRRKSLTEADKVLSPQEQFKQKLTDYLLENLDNGELGIPDMVEEMNMCRSAVFSKCKEACGMTPIEYLRELRFDKAAKLIATGEYNISQVAYMTGFNDSHYFSKSFKQKFGMTPTEYRKSLQAPQS